MMEANHGSAKRAEGVAVATDRAGLDQREHLAIELGGRLVAQESERRVGVVGIAASLGEAAPHASEDGSQWVRVGLGDRSHGLLEEVERVGEAVPRRGAKDGRARDVPAPLLERHQASSEVPAVHGRDVPWKKWLKIRRLVPVEEVPLIVSESLDALERAPDAKRKLARTQVTEVVCRQRREEHHSDVGR